MLSVRLLPEDILLSMRTILTILLALALCILIAGCSSPPPKPVKVSGKITNGKQVLTVPTGARLTVNFIRIFDEPKPLTMFGATYHNDDGSFEVPGPDGQGLPPGKYRVVLKMLPPPAELQDMNTRFDAANSPINLDITSEDPINIDLSSYGK